MCVVIKIVKNALKIFTGPNVNKVWKRLRSRFDHYDHFLCSLSDEGCGYSYSWTGLNRAMLRLMLARQQSGQQLGWTFSTQARPNGELPGRAYGSPTWPISDFQSVGIWTF